MASNRNQDVERTRQMFAEDEGLVLSLDDVARKLYKTKREVDGCKGRLRDELMPGGHLRDLAESGRIRQTAKTRGTIPAWTVGLNFEPVPTTEPDPIEVEVIPDNLRIELETFKDYERASNPGEYMKMKHWANEVVGSHLPERIKVGLVSLIGSHLKDNCANRETVSLARTALEKTEDKFRLAEQKHRLELQLLVAHSKDKKDE